MAATLISSTTAAQGRNNTALSFTVTGVQTGDVLVFKGAVENGQGALGLPATTGETWANRIAVGGGNPDNGYARIDTMVATSAGSKTVTSTATGAQAHSGVVEVWRGAQLAATPATASTTNGGSAPSLALTTVQAASVVSWLSVDWNAVAHTTITYRSSATQEFVTGTAGNDYFAAFAWQNAATAGSQTFGMTAPTGQQPAMAGIEVQSAGGSTVTGTLAGSLPKITGSMAGAQTDPGTLSKSIPRATGHISGVQTNPATLAAGVPRASGNVAGSQRNPAAVSGILARTGGSLAGVLTNPGSLAGALATTTADLPGTQTNTGTLDAELAALVGTIGSGTGDNHATLTATLQPIAGTLAGNSTNPGVLTGELPAITGTLAADSGATGTVTGTLPALAGHLTGVQVNSGSVAGTLPAVSGRATDAPRRDIRILSTGVPTTGWEAGGATQAWMAGPPTATALTPGPPTTGWTPGPPET